MSGAIYLALADAMARPSSVLFLIDLESLRDGGGLTLPSRF